MLTTVDELQFLQLDIVLGRVTAQDVFDKMNELFKQLQFDTNEAVDNLSHDLDAERQENSDLREQIKELKSNKKRK